MTVTGQNESFVGPLRELRLLLGQNFKPMSGEEFAKISGIALGTLRAIETGLRTLNQEDSRRIAHQLFAKWDPVGKRWLEDRPDQEIPYSRETYVRYRQMLQAGTSPRIRDGMLAYSIFPAVFYLLRKLPDSAFNAACLDLHAYLTDLAEAHGIAPEAVEVLKALKPKVQEHLPGLPGRIKEKAASFLYFMFPSKHVRFRSKDPVGDFPYELPPR